ncbi:hypothetical protein GGR50DRAFT_185137 [Xylaria sp. CBS 124048]|nr:hypothetical protein GGR50DRAFT_185137 [Xylaria sp. CBS 124048]
MLEHFASGAAFGAALTATGMQQPSVIIAQMKLENWHMVQTFLTASGASTLVVSLCQKLGYLKFNPRNCSSLGLFSTLDGNIIGGCLLGMGMTLSGSCPGTVFAQVGSGVPSSSYTLGGALLGGLIWTCSLRSALGLRAKYDTPVTPDSGDLTVDNALGASRGTIVAGVGIVFAGIVAVISALGLGKQASPIGPVQGGLLIASAQLLSVLVRDTLLGTSTSFEEFGDHVKWMMKGGGEGKPKSWSYMVVVSGMMVGGLGASFAVPLSQTAAVVSPLRLVLGGALLVLGARIGGGCTSGHGISGISQLSAASFVSVMAMFVGAFGTAVFV